MKGYTEEGLTDLMDRFLKQELPRDEWTHKAHLVVAIWFARTLPLEEALPKVREAIIAHNTAVGTPNTDDEGYHETITKAWLMIAERFLAGNTDLSLSEAVRAFINSDRTDSNALLVHYSVDTLFSVKARHEWVEPDLLPIG